MRKTKPIAWGMRIGSIVVLWLPLALPVGARAQKAGDTVFKDDPNAHALFDQMVDTMRSAQTMYYESEYRWEVRGKKSGPWTYKIWMKKPNFARLEATRDGELNGILVGDGNYFWIYWPNGRPRYGFEDPTDYARTQFTSYMKWPSPRGKHSIAHLASKLGKGMGMPVLNPSTFHGCTDSLQPHLDGVRSLGTETIVGEDCDGIEVSFMNHQRSQYLWLTKRDHLPRRLKQVVRVSHDFTVHELWSNVTIDGKIPDERFSWRPPEGWQRWHPPLPEQGLLKPGAEAPDFELLSADGSKIKLSDYRGKAVWLYFWRVGCPPCRVGLPALEKAYQSNRHKGLVVVGYNCSDDRDITLDFLRKHAITFPNVVDSSETAETVYFSEYQRLGMCAVPLSYLVDREGKILDGWYGLNTARGRDALRQAGIQ